MKTTDNEKFENFIFHLYEIVQNFIKRINSKGYDIDFEKNSIEKFEKYILENNIKVEDNDYYDGACYLGELFRHIYGGNWILDTNKKSIFFNKPVIDYGSESGVLFSSFNALRAIIIKQQSGTLEKIIESNTNPKKIDINFK